MLIVRELIMQLEPLFKQLLWIDFSPDKFTLLEQLPIQSLEVLHL
ncbi:hypothetical protein [Dolichospermum sp. LEGE 00246]|nr:hypothetical protein [Dolichospermum sp. LEGE 00246]